MPANPALLGRDERGFLEALAEGPAKVFTYRGKVLQPDGVVVREKMDELCVQGLARMTERRGDRNSPWGDVYYAYVITPLGLCLLDVATGRHKVSPSELRSAGCC